MTPRLAIFDCDGVLVDSEGATGRVLVDNLARHGLTVPIEDVPSLFVGGTIDGVYATALAMGADLPDTWVEDIYTNGIYPRLRQGVPLIDGVVPLLDALEAAGTQIWVASNGTRQKMQITLGPSGLWDRLAPRILSREDHAPKPAPDMLNYAMAQTGISAKETVMIDDSATGCRAGIAAGVRTFGFAEEGQDASLADVGAHVVNHMNELRTAFGV